MVGRRKPRGIDRSSPAWIITYGDMATLLLVFFVFLFSVSEVRQDTVSYTHLTLPTILLV